MFRVLIPRTSFVTMLQDVGRNVGTQNNANLSLYDYVCSLKYIDCQVRGGMINFYSHG